MLTDYPARTYSELREMLAAETTDLRRTYVNKLSVSEAWLLQWEEERETYEQETLALGPIEDHPTAECECPACCGERARIEAEVGRDVRISHELARAA